MANKRTKAQRKAKNQRRQQEKKAKGNAQPAPQRPSDSPSTPPNTIPTPGIVDEVKPQSGNGSPAQQEQHKPPGLCRRNWKKINWDLVFSACLVFFALVSAVIGKRQWDAMEKQSIEMVKQSKAAEGSAAAAQTAVADNAANARAQLRAYIGLRMEIDRIEPLGDGYHVSVDYRLRIKNHGQTPATAVRIDTQCEDILPIGEEAVPSGCAPAPDGPLDLAPQQENVRTLVRTFHTEDIDKVNAGTHAWVVNFVVAYKDVFDTAQTKTQIFRVGEYTSFAVGDVQGGEDTGVGPYPAGAQEPDLAPAPYPEPMPDLPLGPYSDTPGTGPIPTAPEAPPDWVPETPAAPAPEAPEAPAVPAPEPEPV